MCERLKQAVLKTAVRETVPGVRIPLPPPNSLNCRESPLRCSRNKREGPTFRGIAIGLGVANGWQYCANRQNNGQQDTRSPNHSKLLVRQFRELGTRPLAASPI